MVSCMWSRYVNVLLCDLIDKDSFLRDFQVHIYEHGIPSVLISDNGSPIVAGMQQTVSYLKDDVSKKFLQSRNIKTLTFHPYPAGASELGGFIERLVKEVKKIIVSSVGSNILSRSDFEFLIHETKMLVNKRPLCFKSSLNKLDSDAAAIGAITPEMVVKGRDVPCLSILPQLDSDNLDRDFLFGT